MDLSQVFDADDFDDDDDDEFDDDDDFIALTLKPPKQIQSTQPTSNINTQRPTLNNVTESQQLPELLVAKGEIAVLRSKIADLEKARIHERDELLQNGQSEKETSSHKIMALENAVQRLEDERKFLTVEIKNLSNLRKKRRINEDTQMEDVEQSVPITPEPIIPPPPTSTNTIPKPKPPTIKLAPPRTINENSLFMDSILNHTIIGCQNTTMDFLSHITSSIPFQNDQDPSFKIDPKIPISTSILQYLVEKHETLRLDLLITKFSQNLTLLIQTIFQDSKSSKLSIPFLISLLHATILFRPSAITSETMTNLILFTVDLITHHIFIIKKQEDLTLIQKKFMIPAIQKNFINSLILIFSINLLESLFMNCGNDEVLTQKILEIISSQLTQIFKVGFGSNSCLVVMFSLVETLLIIGHYDGFPEELILLLTQVLNNGFKPRENLFLNGMNRILGDDESCQLISNLITWDGVSDQPCVVYSKTSTCPRHEYHLINLQLRICDLFEKLIISNDDFNDQTTFFNKNPVILKLLVGTISKQQEYIFKSPRSDCTHLRSKLISSIIKNIHLIWELNFINIKTPPRITKDTTHELIITLSRIAFSANITSNEATDFLYQFRKFDKNSIVFNKWCEERAREISHLSINSQEEEGNDNDLNTIINAEVGLSNGLEFAYDDIVVELARDILEKCTTMDEADNLYLSMNAV